MDINHVRGRTDGKYVHWNVTSNKRASFRTSHSCSTRWDKLVLQESGKQTLRRLTMLFCKETLRRLTSLAKTQNLDVLTAGAKLKSMLCCKEFHFRTQTKLKSQWQRLSNQSLNYVKGSLVNIKPQIKRRISSFVFCCKLDTVLEPDVYNSFIG